MTSFIDLYDSPETCADHTLEFYATVPPSARCVNCGGYAGHVLDEPSPCICEGDYRPSWKVALDEIARRRHNRGQGHQR